MAYKAVAARDRTVAQLRAYLERKRAEPEAIEHAVAELRAAGFIDDERYALRFAEDKRTLEHWGSERIERELAKRGVPRELVERAVGRRGREEELAAAVELLMDRVRTPPEGDRERDRAWRLLVRRGYDPDLAYEAVRAYSRDVAA